jgi:heat shock protein 1/8
MRNTMRDDKIASKLSAEDKSLVEKKVEEVIHWLDANQLAEVEEFEHQQKDLESVCAPVMQRLYAGGAGGEGGMPGGMPGGAGAGAGAGAGPTVEEVD